MKNIFKHKEIIYILIVSLVVRILVSYFYSDTVLRNEWSIILHNYQISGIFGFNVVVSESLVMPKFAEIGERVLPTAFMPPLYLYFIYFVKNLSNELVDIAALVVSLQIIFSLISIFIFYSIIKILTDNKLLVRFFTIVFAFFPINVYASSQISSVSLQIFLTLIFFYYLLLIFKKEKLKYIFIFSVMGGLLILIRGEFLIFYIFTLIYFFIFYKKQLKLILISLSLTLLTISPYLIRNYFYFDNLTLTKSFGYNLLKGNNPTFKVEGAPEFMEKIIKKEVKNIKLDNNYEFKLDNIYRQKALNFIRNNPTEYFKLYLLKIFSFLFFDINSTYPNYFNVFHIVPKIVIAITSLIGAIIAINKKGFFQYLSFYFFLNIFLFSVFFILPRYSLILLPVQILLSINFIKYLRGKFFN